MTVREMEDKLKALEKRIKQVGDELVRHARSPHYFSGLQEEEVSALKKRLQ